MSYYAPADTGCGTVHYTILAESHKVSALDAMNKIRPIERLAG